jgi:hypothetical protein
MSVQRLKAIAACAAAAAALAGCSGGPSFDDPFTQYTQRTQTITLGAGDAKEANAAIQVIDPWPRYAYDTRIPGNGQRLADAVERYRDVSKLSKAPKPISPDFGVSIGISGASSGGGS